MHAPSDPRGDITIRCAASGLNLTVSHRLVCARGAYVCARVYSVIYEYTNTAANRCAFVELHWYTQGLYDFTNFFTDVSRPSVTVCFTQASTHPRSVYALVCFLYVTLLFCTGLSHSANTVQVGLVC